MAKISQYAVDGTPSLSDKLIGTEVGSNNETKNYTLSSILTLFGTGSSGFVPYTGANANVNLGTNTLTANSFIRNGGLASQFLKADGSVDSSTYLTTASASSTYVPYTGATGNVSLGSNSISSQDITITGKLSANGGFGTSGQVLTSQGASLPAIWQTPSAGAVTSSLIANRVSTSQQNPSGLDAPMTVAFGGFFSAPELDIFPSGDMQFNIAGTYIIRFAINVAVASAAPSDNIYFQIRSLINGSQVYRTKCLFLNQNPNRSVGYQETFVFTASATNTLEFQVMRSSSGGGLDFGSLVPFTGTGGFANIPSAEIQIWKIG